MFRSVYFFNFAKKEFYYIFSVLYKKCYFDNCYCLVILNKQSNYIYSSFAWILDFLKINPNSLIVAIL